MSNPLAIFQPSHYTRVARGVAQFGQRTAFGTRGSPVQIRAPRPINRRSYVVAGFSFQRLRHPGAPTNKPSILRGRRFLFLETSPSVHPDEKVAVTLKVTATFVLKYALEGPMAKKIDGVIEAVRYNSNGQIVLVRAYERRGATYSDRVLLDRNTLLERLKAGKNFSTGQRKEYLGSTFELGKAVKVVGENGKEFLTTHETATQHDELEETPAF